MPLAKSKSMISMATNTIATFGRDESRSALALPKTSSHASNIDGSSNSRRRSKSLAFNFCIDLYNFDSSGKGGVLSFDEMDSNDDGDDSTSYGSARLRNPLAELENDDLFFGPDEKDDPSVRRRLFHDDVDYNEDNKKNAEKGDKYTKYREGDGLTTSRNANNNSNNTPSSSAKRRPRKEKSPSEPKRDLRKQDNGSGRSSPRFKCSHPWAPTDEPPSSQKMYTNQTKTESARSNQSTSTSSTGTSNSIGDGNIDNKINLRGAINTMAKDRSGKDEEEDIQCWQYLDFDCVGPSPKKSYKDDEFGTEDESLLSMASIDKPKTPPKGHELLCFHVCTDPQCDVVSCRTADKHHSFNHIPVAKVKERDWEMHQMAKQANIPKSRWNGSLLYRKWNEMKETPAKRSEQQKQQQKSHGSKHQENEETKIITLHPVHTLSQAHVVSSKLQWYQPWIIDCIKYYYLTGVIRVPRRCHGFEILLALEFFGILYTSPDQLVFDVPDVYPKVKLWSKYYALRASLAQWVVDELQNKQQQRKLRYEEHQRMALANQERPPSNSIFQQPFIFCTHPDQLKPGWLFCIEPQQRPVSIFEGGLELDDEEDASFNNLGGKDQRSSVVSSASVVHQFFVPRLKSNDRYVEDPSCYSPDNVSAMMREDFTSYLQYILPELEITFTLQTVQLVSTQHQGMHSMVRPEQSLQRAVLVVSWNPITPIFKNSTANNRDDPPGKPSPAPSQLHLPSSMKPPLDHEVASTISTFSAAPTDERDFENLLSSTHKAVARVLEQSAQERAAGREGGIDNGFYFHGQHENHIIKQHLETPGRTFLTHDHPKLQLSQADAADALDSTRRRITTKANKTKCASTGKRDKKKLEPRGTAAGLLRPANVTNERIGQKRMEIFKAEEGQREKADSTSSQFDWHSDKMSVDHIYQDLCQETTHPNPLRKYDLNHSLQHAPIALVNASSQDQVSVTSSITRQPESILSGGFRVQDAQDYHGKGVGDNDSGAKKIQGTRFQAPKSRGIKSWKARIEQGKRLEEEEQLQAALEDIRCGVNSTHLDLDQLRDAANDLCEAFIPSNRPSAVTTKPSSDLQGPKRPRTHPNLRSSPATSSLTTAMDQSTAYSYSRSSSPQRQRSPSISAKHATKNQPEQGMDAADFILQLLMETDAAKAESLKVVGVKGRDSKFVFRHALSRVPGDTSHLAATVDIEDVEEANGIEVYHISSPRPPRTPKSRDTQRRGFPNKRMFAPKNTMANTKGAAQKSGGISRWFRKQG